MENYYPIRTLITSAESLAFGCSHTWGTGVEANETWSYLLGAVNHGVGGCSADFIIRIAPSALEQYQPKIVYILWPDWTRFEIFSQDQWKPMLPMNKDYIKYLETHNETWLKDNFYKQVQTMHKLCKHHDIRLIDMTLYDLIPYIDHADCWPISKLGHHYSPVWHQWVADIFLDAKNNNTKFPLADE